MSFNPSTSAKEAWESFRANPCEDSFHPFYEKSKSLVYTICYRVLRNQEDAADAFQSTYCRLLALARDPGAEKTVADTPTGIVGRLAAREAKNLSERRRRRGKREIAMEKLPNVSDGSLAPDQSAANREERDRVETLVSSLPERYRLPLLLHFFHDMTQAEIAEILEMPIGTIGTQIARGVAKLRPLMRRAGLGESAVALGGILSASRLLDPPASFASSTVFAQAESILLSSGGLGVAAQGAGESVLSKLAFSAAALKSKIALVVAAGVLGTVGFVGLNQVGSKEESPKTEDALVAEKKSTVAPLSTSITSNLAATLSAQEAVAAVPKEETQVAETTLLVSTSAPAVSPIQNATTPTPAAEPGEIGAISGKVYDETTGKPVAHAIVRVIGADLETATGEDGSYRISQIPAGATLVIAEKGVWRSAGLETEITPVRLKPGATRRLNLVIEPCPLILGTVRDMDTEEPIFGATAEIYQNAMMRGNVGADGIVTMRNGKRKGITAQTDEKGRYRLTALKNTTPSFSGAQAAVVRITAERYVSHSASVQFDGKADALCDIELESAAEVSVRIVDEQGTPVEGAGITRSSMTSGEEFLVSWKEKTDSEGRTRVSFSRRRLRAIKAYKDGYAKSAPQMPQFDDNGVAPEITLTLMPIVIDQRNLRAVVGRVTNPLGEPLKNATVAGPQGVRVKTDSDGKYRIECNGPKQALSIIVFHRDFRTGAREKVTLGSVDDPLVLDFVLDKGHWLDIQIVDAEGTPLPGALLEVDSPARENGSILGGTTMMPARKVDQDGRHRALRLAPGEATIRAWGKGFAPTTKNVAVNQEHRIVLRPEAIIQGQVLLKETGEPAPVFTIRVEGKGMDYTRKIEGVSFSDKEGRFTLGQLPPGEKYAVTVEVQDRLPVAIKDITATLADQAEEVLFRVGKGNDIRGVVVDASTGKPLSRLQVAYWRPPSGLNFAWGGMDGASASRYPGMQTTFTDRDGAFRFVETEDRGTVFIWSPPYLPAKVEPSERPARSKSGALRIALKKGGAISGVLSWEGGRLLGAPVSLSLPRSADQRISSYNYIKFLSTDQEGHYRMEGLPASAYEIGIRSNRTHGGLTKRFTLGEGETKTINLAESDGPFVAEGRFLNDEGKPFKEGILMLYPRFKSGYASFQSMTQGENPYRIEGLQAGSYDMVATTALQERLMVTQKRVVEIKENLKRDFIFPKGNKVTARLVFDAALTPEQRKEFVIFTLVAVGPLAPESEAAGVMDVVGSTLLDDGQIVFEAPLQGAYRLTARHRTGRQYPEYSLPKLFVLDNLKAEQHLGDIRVGIPGFIRLTAKYDGSAAFSGPDLKVHLLPLGADPSSKDRIALKVQIGRKEQGLGAVAPGRYTCLLSAKGFQVTPPMVNVEIGPGETFPLAVSLDPAP